MQGYNVKRLKEYAYEVLEASLKHDALDWYIIGISSYSITIKNEMGQEEECIFAKMEAIYQYYKNNPTSQIGKKLEELLAKFTLNLTGFYGIKSVLQCIEYQIVAEKENRAPFVMNNELLLNNLKQNLQQNKTLYQTEPYNKVGFMSTIQQHDEMLSKNYGHKIL